jgi:calreticulin
MRFFLAIFALFALFLGVTAETYYKEEFGKDWDKRWQVSKWKKADGTAGQWKVSSGEWYGDKESAAGLQTSQDARFYSISSKFDNEFSSSGKDLVLQFQIKHPQKIDCGGGYIKLLPSNVDQENFSGDAKYYIMFGPDICGTSTRKVHAIFHYNGQNYLIKKSVNCETDQLSHVYTLLVRADKTYAIYIDGDKKEGGNILDDWDVLPPKTIKDPNQSKPKDWVDEAQIDDPEDKKPEGFDDVAKQIPDPDADKPADWDDEADGKWEAPLIDNPDYKGEWKAKRIPNPAYKGKWVHPEIPNPAYQEDASIAVFDDIGAVGIEIWQVKAGTIFDNIIVTDSLAEAVAFRESTFDAVKAQEKTMFDEVEKERLAKEEADRKKLEEERAKADDDEDEEDDDEDDDDDDDDDEDDKKKKSKHDEL